MVLWSHFIYRIPLLFGIIRIPHAPFNLHLPFSQNGIFYIHFTTCTYLYSTWWDECWLYTLCLFGQHLWYCFPPFEVVLWFSFSVHCPSLICPLFNIRTLFSCLNNCLYPSLFFQPKVSGYIKFMSFDWFDLLKNKVTPHTMNFQH